MEPCPVCGVAAYSRAGCTACGYGARPQSTPASVQGVPVVTGTPLTGAPPVLDMSALIEVGASEVATSTTELGFQYSSCPTCQSPVPQPNPAFCDACGFKMRKPKTSASAKKTTKRRRAEDEETVRCGECGSRNGESRAICISCGGRLRTGGIGL